MAKDSGNGHWRNRIIEYGTRPASQFQAHPRNWRKHPKAQREALAASLNTVGWVGVVLENARTGHLLDGHERLWQALEQGDETPVPYIEVDVSEDEEHFILATLDPIGAMAETDADMLAGLLAELGDVPEFDDAEIGALLAEIAEQTGVELEREALTDPGPQIDRAEELREQWQTERGQVWEILSASVPGRAHRLMCGDSTSAADVARLMAGEKAQLVVTSPPYSDARDYTIGDFDWHALMVGVWDNITAIVDAEVDILINLGLVHRDRRVQFYWQDWIEHADKGGWPLFGWYVWDKGRALPGEWNGRLAPAHEFVFHFRRGGDSANKHVRTKTEKNGKRHTFRQKDGSLKDATSPDKIGQPWKIPDSVIRISPASGPDMGHPAMYSAEFAAFMLETWQDAGAVAYEPFCGAGTTIVAGEQTQRVVYGMEIEPKYVAVTLQRLADMGLEPRLASEG